LNGQVIQRKRARTAPLLQEIELFRLLLIIARVRVTLMEDEDVGAPEDDEEEHDGGAKAENYAVDVRNAEYEESCQPYEYAKP
jgi:hypothetical protein